MSKQKIREWLVDNYPDMVRRNENVEFVSDIIHKYTKEQSGWVSITREDDFSSLMVAGTLVFWHKVHKCEVTGFIVRNELEDKILQGEYSVIEQTKTTKWPIDSFTFVKAPSLPPTEEV